MWLLSLSMFCSSSCWCISVVHSLVLLLSIVYVWFPCSPAGGHLDYFWLGAIMNKASVNFHLQVFIGTYYFISFCRYSGVELLSCMWAYDLLLKKLPSWLLEWQCHFMSLPGVCKDCSFPTSSPTLCIVCLLDNSYFSECVKGSHYSFNLYFSHE